MTSIAANIPATGNTKTAPSSGKPVSRDMGAPNLMRFGPVTAPAVLIQTTSARSRARVCGVDRSVAAKRAWRLAALPTPMSAPPTSSSRKFETTAEMMMEVAPMEARASPVTREMRRPLEAASRASARDERAAPNVDAVVTDPAQASDPASFTAISDPTETTDPAASPLRICAVDSRMIERRRSAATSGVSNATGTGGSITGDMVRPYLMYPPGV